MGLRVLLGDIPVGRLICDVDRCTVSFRFDEGYIELARRPVLSRYFEDYELHAGSEFTGDAGRPPNYFRNCLPEGALRRLVEREVQHTSFREYRLLQTLGSDLPGAVRLVDDQIEADPEDEAPQPHMEAVPEGSIRFSVAGIQPKIAVVLDDDDKIIVPTSGLGGRWFAKLPSRSYPDLVENEHAMLRWARRSGLNVPDHKLHETARIVNLPPSFEVSGPKALIVKRYDREGEQRVHQEDFAQVFGLPPEHKYQGQVPSDIDYVSIARIVRCLCGVDDFDELLRRLVFMVLSGNADAHVKNWSLLYPDGRRPRLAPAYDLVATVAYESVGRTPGLDFLGATNLSEIGIEHFCELTRRVGGDGAAATRAVEEFVARAREEWVLIRVSDDIPERVRDAIDQHLASLHGLYKAA